jgi:ribosomal protein S18 acetylase RimI-like enzyme
MSVVITRASPEEAFEIADFSRRSFYESFADQNTAEDMEKFMLRFSMETLMTEVSDQANTFFIARENDVLIGYVKLTTVEKLSEFEHIKEIEISRIYVDQQVLGKGTGKRLMQTALDFARDCDYQVAWLGVWEHNYAAQAFYQKFGFERFSEHIFMLGDDPQTDWLLKRDLN